jgi:transcriptional regulator with XRE-family HTH domain
MELTIGDRIDKIKSYKGLNYSKLGKILGYSDVQMGNICKNKSLPKVDIINKIKENFPEINLEWVLFGKSEMIKSSKVNVKKDATNDFDSDTILTLLELLFFHEDDLKEKSPMYKKWAQRKELRAYNDGAEAMKNKLQGIE